MGKLNIQTPYCLLISGKITENLSKKKGSLTETLYRVEVSVVPLSEEESKKDSEIKRILANRLETTGSVIMYENPERFKNKLFSVEKKGDETLLILVISGIL